jgi:hypothetical protein
LARVEGRAHFRPGRAQEQVEPRHLRRVGDDEQEPTRESLAADLARAARRRRLAGRSGVASLAEERPRRGVNRVNHPRLARRGGRVRALKAFGRGDRRVLSRSVAADV